MIPVERQRAILRALRGGGSASINDLAIAESDRLFHWDRGDSGRRPDDHPGLEELGL